MLDWLVKERERYRMRTGIGRYLAPLLEEVPRIRVAFDDVASFVHDARIERDGNTLDILCPRRDRSNFMGLVRSSIASYAYQLLRCDPSVRVMSVVVSDGNFPSKARFSPSTSDRSIVLIPDSYFMSRRGFREERERSERDWVPWDQRSTRIHWRGMCHGEGEMARSRDQGFDLAVKPRLRMCLILNAVDGVEAKMTDGARLDTPFETLVPLGITGGRREESAWLGDRYALDVDGWTNTWSNMIIRMHYGCCIIKIESEKDYRQWYYNRLKPFEHYVPVKPDMSDLVETIDWVRSHDSEARAIAENGRALVRSMTFESETDYAVDTITRHWQG